MSRIGGSGLGACDYYNSAGTAEAYKTFCSDPALGTGALIVYATVARPVAPA